MMKTFEEWWASPWNFQKGLPQPKDLAKSAWNEQQKKIDALEAKLAIAVEALKSIEQFGIKSSSTMTASKALATLNAKEKVE